MDNKTVDTAVNELVDTMQPATVPAEAIKPDMALLKDRRGKGFDPAIHQVDKDGNPVLSSNNRLCRKPGRPTTQPRKPKLNLLPVEKPVEKPPEIPPVPIAEIPPVPSAGIPAAAGQSLTPENAGTVAAANMAAESFFTIGIMTFGKDWKPSAEEHDVICQAFNRYFAAKGIDDIPPGIGLTIALAGFSFKRIVDSAETQTKLQRFKTWCGQKYLAYKNWRASKKAKIPAVEKPA